MFKKEIRQKKLLIVLEGLPGTGKTTLGQKIAKKFKGIFIPQIIKKLQQKKILFHTTNREKFFLENDLMKYERAIKALKIKKLVIMDRGIFSTLAYNYAFSKVQGENTFEFVFKWYKKHKRFFSLPQIIFLFDIPVEISLKRKGRIASKDSKENSLWCFPPFLKLIQKFYHNFLPSLLTSNMKIIKIDSKEDIRKIFKIICQKLHEYSYI